MTGREFTAVVAASARGHVLVPVPFARDEVWGVKLRHHIGGTVNGMRVRGVVEAVDDGFGFTLGPAWLDACGLGAGDVVTVRIEPEGPQQGDLAEDVAAAFQAHPAAAVFFGGLAQFYRRAYLRWIDATQRKPELRAERIAATMRLLETGHNVIQHIPRQGAPHRLLQCRPSARQCRGAYMMTATPIRQMAAPARS